MNGLAITRLRVTALAALLAAVAGGCRRGAESTAAAHDGPQPRILEGGSERPARLLFGVTPVLPGEVLRREYEALAEHLGKRAGITVELVASPNYAKLSEQLAAYEVHLGLLSPLAYIKAKQMNPGLILLATMIADGTPSYSSYVVVRDDSPHQRLEDLRGKVFGFVDPYSTSGYLYPVAHMLELGIQPRSFFSRTLFAGEHQALVDMVLDGRVDAGATYTGAMKGHDSTIAGTQGLRIIAKTGRIPYDAFCASPRLEQSIIEAVRAALLGLDTRTDEGRRVLSGRTGINGFIAAGDDHYDEVRRVAQLVEKRAGASDL